MAYEAIVVRLKNVRPHPDPKVERIQLAECLGNQVIVSKDNFEDQLGIYFPTDGCLNKDFALCNSLYRKHPETGEAMGGYFEDNLRVRTQKFMNEQSDGFWCPIEYLQNYVGNFDVKEGQTFSSYNGKEICSKYFTPQTNGIRERNQQIKKSRIPSTFKEHFDTEAFIKAHIPVGAKLIITEKMEGTSGRYGLHEDKSIYSKWQTKLIFHIITFLSMLRIELPIFKVDAWKYYNGTRRTVLSDRTLNHPDDKGESYRQQVVKNIILEKGETLYYEIVGFDSNGASIMKAPTLNKNHKELFKLYPTLEKGPMYYSYGHNKEINPFGMYVYHITKTDSNGNIIHYTWDQVVNRCRELNLKTVPYLDTIIYSGDKEATISILDDYCNGVSTLDNKHIREGVCIRVEDSSQEKNNILRKALVYKHKSFYYKLLAGLIKDDPNYIDEEEIS